MLGLAIALSCEPSKSSPPETRPAARDAAPPDPECLAQTHPILAHALRIPRSRLSALTTDGRDSVPLGRGEVVYGSVWAPDGRSIAFRRRADFQLDVAAPTELGLLVPGETEHEVVLVTDVGAPIVGVVPSTLDGPSWSPDGQWLAFASLRDSSHWRIWTIARSGGQLRPMFPDLADVSHFDLDWSDRDTGRVVFVVDRDGVLDLWIAERDGGAARNLTRGRLASVGAPRWSPDGRRIAFSANELEPRGREGPDIYVIDASDGALQRVTREGANFDPVWSPDGGNLLVSRTPSALDAGMDEAPNLWLLSLDGDAGAEQLTETGALASDWYPSSSCR